MVSISSRELRKIFGYNMRYLLFEGGDSTSDLS